MQELQKQVLRNSMVEVLSASFWVKTTVLAGGEARPNSITPAELANGGSLDEMEAYNWLHRGKSLGFADERWEDGNAVFTPREP